MIYKIFMVLCICILMGCMVIIVGHIENDRKIYTDALEIQAEKIEVLYEKLTGTHGVRLPKAHE